MLAERKEAQVRSDVFKKGYADPVYFCRTFLPHFFPTEMPWFHRGLLALFTRKVKFLTKYGEIDKIIAHFRWSEDPDNEKAVTHPIFYWNGLGELCMHACRFSGVMVPRGFSKTTLANGAALYCICYNIRKYILYVSEGQEHAEDQLGTVKNELEENDLLRDMYGDLVPERNSSKKWTNKLVQTTNDVVVRCVGRGGQVRGKNTRAIRPDLIIVDDVEDTESVSTPEQRHKAKTWAYRDLMPALPRTDKTAMMIALGTLLHRESLLMVWMRDPRFNFVVLGAIDNDGDALAEVFMTLQEIEDEKVASASAGMLAAFYMEYMSQLRNDETAKFKERYFRYNIEVPEELHKAICIDPAISDQLKSDFTCIAVAGMEKGGQIHILETWGKKGATPREQIDKYFEFHRAWDPDYSGVEANAYQAALVHLLREEMFRKKRYFEVTPITHSTKKIERVEGVLQPRYAAGYIIHRRRFARLESQLLDWPNGKMDYPDCVAMCITLLDPYAAQAADPEKDLGDDDYKSLEETYGGDWRTRL